MGTGFVAAAVRASVTAAAKESEIDNSRSVLGWFGGIPQAGLLPAGGSVRDFTGGGLLRILRLGSRLALILRRGSCFLSLGRGGFLIFLGGGAVSGLGERLYCSWQKAATNQSGGS
jgi:hypothetical protein